VTFSIGTPGTPLIAEKLTLEIAAGLRAELQCVVLRRQNIAVGAMDIGIGDLLARGEVGDGQAM
jgi:hypothetical protein